MDEAPAAASGDDARVALYRLIRTTPVQALALMAAECASAREAVTSVAEDGRESEERSKAKASLYLVQMEHEKRAIESTSSSSNASSEDLQSNTLSEHDDDDEAAPFGTLWASTDRDNGPRPSPIQDCADVLQDASSLPSLPTPASDHQSSAFEPNDVEDDITAFARMIDETDMAAVLEDMAAVADGDEAPAALKLASTTSASAIAPAAGKHRATMSSCSSPKRKKPRSAPPVACAISGVPRPPKPSPKRQAKPPPMEPPKPSPKPSPRQPPKRKAPAAAVSAEHARAPKRDRGAREREPPSSYEIDAVRNVVVGLPPHPAPAVEALSAGSAPRSTLRAGLRERVKAVDRLTTHEDGELVAGQASKPEPPLVDAPSAHEAAKQIQTSAAPTVIAVPVVDESPGTALVCIPATAVAVDQPSPPKRLEKQQVLVIKPIPNSKNVSGYKGVYPGRKGRWQAQVGHKSIGGFPTAWEAGVAVATEIARRDFGLCVATSDGEADDEE